tara:strand:- start:26 stop:415 length:390 start_codon:yes stop_codon:yes gene_type:complete
MPQIQPLLDPIGGQVYTATIANASAVNDPLADTVGTANRVTVYQIEVDNTLNAAVTYLKVYNAASPAHASNAPFYILRVEASTKQHVIFPAGTEFGYFSHIVTSTLDNSAGASATANSVDIAVLYSGNP